MNNVSRVVTVTLNPAIDKTVKVPRFQTGKEFLEEELNMIGGGKGINVARVLTRLGVNSLATGMIGGMAEHFMEEQLKAERIKGDFISLKGHTRINLTIIDPKSKRVTRVLDRGPRVSPREIKKFKQKYTALLKKCGFVVLAGRNAVGVKDSIYAELIRIAKRHNVRAILDTHGTPLRLGIKAKPFVIKPNLHEAEALLRRKLNSLSKIKQAVTYLHGLGPAVVLMSLGEEGAVGYDGRQMLLARAPTIKHVNSVGSGDAFTAGFLWAYIKSPRLEKALKAAVAAGTANARTVNPGYLNRRHVHALMKKVKIKVLK